MKDDSAQDGAVWLVEREIAISVHRPVVKADWKELKD
jgi:hypothetical protein